MHPPNPCLVHRLPPAPHFVGREAELDQLRDLWRGRFAGLVALVGLGGAGKTATAARFLDDLLGPEADPRPEGLFVWSFYQEPDAGLFLQQAYRYFCREGAGAAPARGAGLLHLLRDALDAGGPHLLVLDGLERVQRQEGGSEQYGELEDPLLKGLLTRLADGTGRTMVLITSRFPLTDLEPLRKQGYRHLDIGGLDRADAQKLLRHRGVQGDDSALAGLLDTYGTHCLTLDHLGGLIGQFLGGDPARAPELPTLAPAANDRQAMRLARLLRAYEEHLPPAELALLCRLCLLRRSVPENQLVELFLCFPAVHARTIRELRNLLPLLSEDKQHPDLCVSDVIEAVQTVVEEALFAAPIAGPEETFRQQIVAAVECYLAEPRQNINDEIAELGRLYTGTEMDAVTNERPLGSEDRQAFLDMCNRYFDLREHALMPFKEPAPALEKAFQELGWQKSRQELAGELGAHDLVEAFRRVYQRLRHLVDKHFILRQVHELCGLSQTKWALAGPLAPLDLGELRRVLDRLVAQHLVLREGGSLYTVHPAVRDHFYRLATASRKETWHDLISAHLVSLIRRPGRSRPEDAATLDAVEEAIHHAQEAGRVQEAWRLYEDVLGGLRHLAWKLGEMGRGLRILRSFDPCPDRWAFGWFLRGMGELEEAYARNDLPFFRADIRLLQGRLTAVAAEGDSTRTAIAAFLMGETQTLPPDALGCPIPRVQLLVYRGLLERARWTGQRDQFYADIGWEGDRARCQLFLAEVAHRQADLPLCRRHLYGAMPWILNSGSVEHLCLLHLIRARACQTAAGEMGAARKAVEEGLHVATQSGLGLYLVELLCEKAAIELACHELGRAEAAAWEARGRAMAADCQFLWGEAAASHLLGMIFIAGQRLAEARLYLEKALNQRRHLGDPRADESACLLNGLAN
jgi:hypothetical protein